MATTQEFSYHSSDILKSVSAQVCQKLSVAEDSLLLFSGKLFEKSIIDKATKNSVRRTKGYEGADILMDYLMEKLEGSPLLLDDIVSLMKQIDLLQPIALEIEKKSDSGVPRFSGGESTDGNNDGNSSVGDVCTDGPVYRGKKIRVYKYN